MIPDIFQFLCPALAPESNTTPITLQQKGAAYDI